MDVALLCGSQSMLLPYTANGYLCNIFTVKFTQHIFRVLHYFPYKGPIKFINFQFHKVSMCPVLASLSIVSRIFFSDNFFPFIYLIHLKKYSSIICIQTSRKWYKLGMHIWFEIPVKENICFHLNCIKVGAKVGFLISEQLSIQ